MATNNNPTESPYKSKGGIARLYRALGYSAQGLAAALRHEAAFRQELLLVSILTPVALWLGRNIGEILLLVGVLFFVLVIELLNSGLETLADAITLDDHPLIGRAKDLGSAAVMLSILFAATVWICVIIGRFLMA